MIRMLLVGVTVMALGGFQPGVAEDVELSDDSLNSSRKCAECHQEIYKMWKRSMHSASFTDPIFKFSYMQAYFETQGEASQVCLRCHAPAAEIIGDLNVEQEISREGVTCDFCHSVESVDLSRNESPFEVITDGVKRGPLTKTDSPAHQVASSDLHKSSEFCAGCHEWTNPRGVAVLTTYSEWKRGPMPAEGKTCQTCHMPLQAGRSVRAGLGVNRKMINLHNISGMHSNEQVKSAAEARILRVKRKNNGRAVVAVEVANVGSGHAIPTGLSTRKLVLEVMLFRGGSLVKRFEKTYQRRLVDKAGKVLSVDHKAMLDAAGVLDDNRLLPGERRVEKFFAEVPSTGSLRAEMRLIYTYSPMLPSKQPITIEIAEAKSQ